MREEQTRRHMGLTLLEKNASLSQPLIDDKYVLPVKVVRRKDIPLLQKQFLMQALSEHNKQ
jgi:hypothetical protein